MGGDLKQVSKFWVQKGDPWRGKKAQGFGGMGPMGGRFYLGYPLGRGPLDEVSGKPKGKTGVQLNRFREKRKTFEWLTVEYFNVMRN